MTHGADRFRAGVVDTFDDHAGWGTIRDDDGAEWFFHCTKIADGTRTITIGTRVNYEIAPIGLGTWEATRVATCDLRPALPRP